MTKIDAATPVGAQLGWVVNSLFAGDLVDDDELHAHFHDTFLVAVPAEMIRGVAASIASMDGVVFDGYRGTDFQAELYVHVSEDIRRRITITVDDGEPHQILGLAIGRPLGLAPPPVAVSVVVLNGTSSSGKTSIATALRDALPGTWLHVSVDAFLAMANNLEYGIDALLRGYHGSIGALAHAENRVIVDHVLEQPEWFEQLAGALGDLPALFVGVQCPLEVLEQRERDRGDRGIGTARAQSVMVHRHGLYDIEIDTSTMSPAEAATLLASRVIDGPPPPPMEPRLRSG